MQADRQITLGDLCSIGLAEIQTGPFGSQLHAHEYVTDGIPVVSTEAIGDRRINSAGLPKVTEQKARTLSRHLLRVNDILFARRGVQATGKIALVREAESGFLCGTGAIRLRLKEPYSKVLPEFLSHVLNSSASIAWFKFHAIGATMPNLNEGIIRRFPFWLPPHEVQVAVVALLGSLDDKIDLNRLMNETLDGTARAIFKDWFVDFGPTRAKMERRAPSLSHKLWDLFPDMLNNAGMPEGWSLNHIASIARLAKQTIMPSASPDMHFWHYSLPAYDNGREPDKAVGSAILSNKTLIPSNAILLSKLNPETPRVWLPEAENSLTAICSTEFLAFQPLQASNRYLLASIFVAEAFRQRLEAIVTGTSKSHQRVRPQSVLDMAVSIPSPQVANAFAEIAGPLFEREMANRREIRTLAAARDLILPKFMSGKLRVSDAEQVAEAVL